MEDVDLKSVIPILGHFVKVRRLIREVFHNVVARKEVNTEDKAMENWSLDLRHPAGSNFLPRVKPFYFIFCRVKVFYLRLTCLYSIIQLSKLNEWDYLFWEKEGGVMKEISSTFTNFLIVLQFIFVCKLAFRCLKMVKKINYHFI